MLIISKGYRYDGPSGPTIDCKKSLRAALAHDALYQLIREDVIPKKSRVLVDKLFYQILREDGFSKFRAKYYYYAVRLFGGIVNGLTKRAEREISIYNKRRLKND